MWFKIKSLFLAEVTLSLWASAASATWPRITGSHFTACTLVALLPCYPVFRYILFLSPGPSSCSSFTLSSFGALPFESKVSSAVVRRQPQAAATRQQQSKADTHPLAANDSDICPWPSPHLLLPSLLPIVNWQWHLHFSCCFAWIFHVDDEWTRRKASQQHATVFSSLFPHSHPL